MKTLRTAMIITASLLFLNSCASNKPNVPILNQSTPSNISQTQPQFYVETFNMADLHSFEKSVTNILPIIPFSELVFMKNNDLYQAAYDVDLWIVNTKNDSILFHTNSSEITNAISDYRKTKDPLNYAGLILSLTGQGNYQLNIKITDKATTRAPSQITIPISMRNVHTGALSLSDPLVFTTLDGGEKFFNDMRDTTAIKNTNIPLNSQTLDPRVPIHTVFEVYYTRPYTLLSSQNKQLVITYSLFSEKNEVIEGAQTFNIVSNTKRQTVGIQFPIPKNIKNGIYNLVLQASIQDTNTNIVEKNSRTIKKTIRIYSPIPQTDVELDELIDNLSYVLEAPPKKVIKKLKHANNKEKEELYRAFWEKRGGRYAMEQHYVRVAYANEHYSSIDGFRKMVCIRYGPPISPNAGKQTLSIHTAAGDVYFEIWQYYKIPANDPYYFWPTGSYYNTKTFIFIDEYGFGTYTFGGRYGYGRLERHNDHEFYQY